MNLFDVRNPFVTLVVFGSLLILIYLSWGLYAILERSRELDKFHLYLAHWQQLNLQNYEYIIEEGCMFVSTTKATVQHGVHDFSGSEHLHIDGTTTIEDLFAILETALKSSYQLEVSYDPYYGFPQLVHVDWSREIIDDECFYDVKTFKSR